MIRHGPQGGQKNKVTAGVEQAKSCLFSFVYQETKLTLWRPCQNLVAGGHLPERSDKETKYSFIGVLLYERFYRLEVQQQLCDATHVLRLPLMPTNDTWMFLCGEKPSFGWDQSSVSFWFL